MIFAAAVVFPAFIEAPKTVMTIGFDLAPLKVPGVKAPLARLSGSPCAVANTPIGWICVARLTLECRLTTSLAMPPAAAREHAERLLGSFA